MMKIRPLAALSAAALAAACSDSSGPDRVACDPALMQQATLAGDTVTTATGLQYIEIQPGSGAAAESSHVVRVHYAGYLTSGARFDTSCTSERPISFIVGTNQVVPGFWQGIIGMRVGGTRRLVIPPALGYGDRPPAGSTIPANATLVFDVELVDILND